jgi:predicted metal-dependent HD superfamily phosphohydrolase
LFDLKNVKDKAIELLSTGLSEKLTYHCFPHTVWVVQSCHELAMNEGISDPNQLRILETAAWLHDAGFTRTYFNHEEKSCEIATEILTELGADAVEIDKVCELIMSTKIPQSPCCHLGQIICDADLDYLGRDDFFPWSKKLKEEWYNFGMITSEEEFEVRQLKFLTAHKYHTKDAQTRREPVKQKYLEDLRRDSNLHVSV